MTTPLSVLVEVELRRLAARPGARLGWFVSASLAVPALLVGWLSSDAVIQLNGAPLVEPATAARAVSWALWMRQMGLMPALVTLLAVALSAGEAEAHTLRDDLVRPIERSHVVLARWVALVGWSTASVTLTLVAASVGGLVLFDVGPGWPSLGVEAALCIGSDGLIAAIALAVGFASRSSLGALTGLVTLLIAAAGLGIAVWIAGLVHGMGTTPNPLVGTALEFASTVLPQAAWAAWRDAEHTLQPLRVGALALWTTAALGMAAWTLRQRSVA